MTFNFSSASKLFHRQCKTVLLTAVSLLLPMIAVAGQRSDASSSGLTVSLPNGYANISVDDLHLMSKAGEVRWKRSWDGQEWKFQPQWESLSHSWKNLTGSQTAEGAADGGVIKFLSSGEAPASGCWVWVDEDWQSNEGSTIIGGVLDGGVMPAVRSTPFNRLMGDLNEDYQPPQRVSVDYASLCPGMSGGGSGASDMEAIRRINELYLGENGRYAFNNRSILEKATVRQLSQISAEALYQEISSGRIVVRPATNVKGFRWTDKGGAWIEYNTQGQIVGYGDRNNNQIWMYRDAAGVLRGVVDSNGLVLLSLHYRGELLVEVRDYAVKPGEIPRRTVRYEYDVKNRLVAVTDVRGYTTRYEYDTENHLVKITDAEGRNERLVYNGATVQQKIAADGGVTDYTFDYDDANKQFLAKVVGPQTASGRRIDDFTYNRVGRLVRQITNGQIATEVMYDTGARSEIVKNARGLTTRATTNEFNMVVEYVNPDGSVQRRQYSPIHLRLETSTDEIGYRTKYQYDSIGNLLKKVEAESTPDERVTEYLRNSEGRVVQLISRGHLEVNGKASRDAVWEFAYDELGQLAKTIDPEGNVRKYVYDRAGNLLSYTDPLGNSMRYEVDADGNLLLQTDALGHTRRYVYDKVGNLVTEVDSRGAATLRAFDAMNRVSQMTNPIGGVARVQYDAQGLPITESDEDGQISSVQYDNFQRLIQQVDGRGNVTTHDYLLADGSSEGLLGSLSAPTRTRYPTYTQEDRFDSRERLTSSTLLNPTLTGVEGLPTTNKYDQRGRLIETTNAEGKTNFFAYDAHGRTTKFTNSLGESIALSWDVRGNLIEVKDARGNTTRFDYDRASRLIQETAPLGQTTRYTYDAKGNRETVVDALGQRIAFTYDAADRPLKTEVFARGSTTPSLTYSFTHDENDQLTMWSDGTRSGHITYDDAGRKIAEKVVYGNDVSLSYSYEYTPAGRLKRLIYPDSSTVEYRYSEHGEVAGINIPGEGGLSVDDWKWMAPAKITFPGGVTREMAHDGLLKMTGAQVKGPGQQTIFELANQYGLRQELKQKLQIDTLAGVSSTLVNEYRYDAELRLSRVTREGVASEGLSAETFQFDPAGNRVSHSVVNGMLRYDENNRLVQRGSGFDAISYKYDQNGNLTQQEVGGNWGSVEVRKFEYDALNRLSAVTDGSGRLIAEYQYDPFDVRLSKTVYRDESGQELASPKKILFLHSEEGLIAQAEADGTVETIYGWSPDGAWGMAPLFIRTKIKGVIDNNAVDSYAYFHNDHLGTPLRATSRNGEILWRADYNSLGQASLPSGNRLTSNLRFAGQYYDFETGLHYNNRRYYDPVAGRYISQDPIGVSGGWNLYDYANGDPVNNVDPTGEWFWFAVQAAFTVYDLYTEYQQYKETGCFDWTRFIPLPRWVPRIKWIPKRFRKCLNPCECLLGGGGGNSFTADTLVHTLDDNGSPSLRPISTLNVGDLVLAKSEWKQGGESLSYERILDVLVTPAQERRLVDLVLENGRQLTATDGHPFHTPDGWRDAILLKAGGEITLQGEMGVEETVRISRISHRLKTETTYNLEVANAHTFFVGEDALLVHNGKRPPNLTPPGGGRRGAFREAKRNCNIPMCRQPDKVGPSQDRKGKRLKGRTYTFGECEIREHADGHDYPDDPQQNRGPHFNDPNEGHYDF